MRPGVNFRGLPPQSQQQGGLQNDGNASKMRQYEIHKLLGKGTFGSVYLVRDRIENKNFVMKKISIANLSAKEKKAAQLETKLLQKLQHPNIVSYKDSFIHRGRTLCIVMALCENGDVWSQIEKRKKMRQTFKTEEILDYFIQMCLALQHLHERKILHRDIKTQNVFLNKENVVKLGDFGIAKVLDGTLEMAQTVIGTPYYMSPELFKNRPYSYKSDVWALGCVLYELVTMRHAFDARDMDGLVKKIMRGAFSPIPDRVHPDLKKLLKSMLSTSPNARPSIQEILEMPFLRDRIHGFAKELLGVDSSRGRALAEERKGAGVVAAQVEQFGIDMSDARREVQRMKSRDGEDEQEREKQKQRERLEQEKRENERARARQEADRANQRGGRAPPPGREQNGAHYQGPQQYKNDHPPHHPQPAQHRRLGLGGDGRLERAKELLRKEEEERQKVESALERLERERKERLRQMRMRRMNAGRRPVQNGFAGHDDGLGDLQQKLRRAELERAASDKRRHMQGQARMLNDQKAVDDLRELERLEQREAELKRALDRERNRQREMARDKIAGYQREPAGQARGAPMAVEPRPDISRMSHREKITYLKAERQKREDAAKMAELNRAMHAQVAYSSHTHASQQQPYGQKPRGRMAGAGGYLPEEGRAVASRPSQHDPERAQEVEEEEGLAAVVEEEEDDEVAEEVVEELENDPWMKQNVKTIDEYKNKLAKHTLNAQLLRMQMKG